MDQNNDFTPAPRGEEHMQQPEVKQVPQPEAQAVPQPEAPVAPQVEAQAVPQVEAQAAPQPEAPVAPQVEAQAVPQPEAPQAETPRTPPQAAYQAPVPPPRPYVPLQYTQPQGEQAPPPPKKKKKTGNGIVIALGSVAAACLLFAGGAVIGHLVGGEAGPTGMLPAFGSDNMPTVSISQTPSLDPDNYDVVNGLAGEEVYKKVNPSIVSVVATSLNGGGTGSGVIMTEDGYIITNNHVVADAQAVAVQLADGARIEAEVIGTDEQTNLAVLKIEHGDKLIAAEFGDSDQLQPGEYAYAIGSPGGLELANTITGGRISAINRDITVDDRVMTLIQTDASINPGNSGGALINKYGQVVGITSAKLGISYYEGLGFAIPMNTAKAIVEELISTGYIAGRPSIGISGYNVTSQMATYNNVPQGVYVDVIDARAQAAGEGLKAGDIITEVDGQPITTMDEINAIKEEKKAGDTLALKVYRMSTGKVLELTITLTDQYALSSEPEAPVNPAQGYDSYSQYGQGQDPFAEFFGW